MKMNHEQLDQMLLEILISKCDHEDRATRPYLRAKLGVKDRDVRRARERLLQRGWWICSDDQGGYWLAESDADKRAFLKFYLSRALTMLKTASLLENTLTNQIIMEALKLPGEGGEE